MGFKTADDGHVYNDDKKNSSSHHGSVRPETGIKTKSETIKIGRKGNDEIVGIDTGKIHNKIVIKNGIISPNHNVIEAIIGIWSEIPDDVKKTVKEIRVSETKDGSGAFGMWESKKRILHLYLTNKVSTIDDIEDTFSHELAHADFDNKLVASKPDSEIRKKMIKYFDELGLLPPITFYSKEFYDDWINSKSRLGKNDPYYDPKFEKEENAKLLAYLNEEHSETAMYVAAPDRRKGELGVLYKPAMDKAVQYFKELHSQ